MRRARLFAVVFMVAGAAGCAKRTTRLTITSFSAPGDQTSFVEQFPDGVFARNAHGNYQIALELPPRRMPIPPDPAPTPATSDTPVAAATTNITANQAVGGAPVAEEVYIAQLVYIDLLWQPLPGTTFAESSQTNAGITYTLLRGQDMVRYEGAGFVYLEVSDDGVMTGEIESATLYPVSGADEGNDVLGRCRLTGEFLARRSKRRVTDVQRRLAALAKNPNRWVGQTSSP